VVVLKSGEYENCQFLNCQFTNADLSDMVFDGCTFTNCNMSMVKLVKTTLRDVVFINCKMLGVHFDHCNGFGLSFRFQDCVLDHSSFYQMKLKKLKAMNTQFHEVDLTGCDLTEAVFDNCDLMGAMFDYTVLERADMRTAYNYAIDPERNRIAKARFSLNGIAGLLGKYNIKIED
jgi:fluoroquinolone resistance protein